MAGPGQGMRSEPIVEARVGRILALIDAYAAGNDVADTASRQWRSNLDFLMIVAPEEAGSYLEQTLLNNDDGSSLPRVIDELSERKTYLSTQAIEVLLGYAQKHMSQEEFSKTLGGAAKVCAHEIVVVGYFRKSEHSTLVMMMEKFDLAGRTDIYSAKKNYANLINTVALSSAQIDQPMSEELRETRRAILRGLFELGLRYGGTLEHGYTCQHTRRGLSGALAEICTVYDDSYTKSTYGATEAILALLDAGAQWSSVYEQVKETREIIDGHPRVKAERLKNLAHGRSGNNKDDTETEDRPKPKI